MRDSKRWIVAAITALLLGSGVASAQGNEALRHDDGSASETNTPEWAGGDGALPTSPRGAMYLFLVASRAGDFVEAARFLDLSGVPEAEREASGPRIARQLKIVLDQTLWIDFAVISNLPTGDLNDGLPVKRERVGVLESAGGAVPLWMERDSKAEGAAWRFAAPFVDRVPSLYKEFGHGWLGEWLPARLFRGSFLEIQPWQWIALAISLLGALLLGWGAARLGIWLLGPLVSRTRGSFDDRLVATARGPLTLLLAVVLFRAAALTLGLSVPAASALSGASQFAAILAITWLLFRVVDIGAVGLAERARIRSHLGLASVLPLARVSLKAALGVLALIVGLQNFGVNVTGLLAGLGFGGLAFALAAQKSLENLFGGITVVADQPVRVGDFCRFGDLVGTVEDVGLRSTRLRTLDRTIVTVPNAEFAAMQIENFAKRDAIRFAPTLGLRYETTPDQMRFVLIEIRRLLYAHPMINPESARVRFVGFGASSLDLAIQCYIQVTDWAEYLKVAEDLNLRLMDIVNNAGSGFAFPSQTLYVDQDGGLDADRTGRAEEAVAQWRDRGELALPDFSSETIRELAGSLRYPEEGAVNRDA